MTTAEVLVVDDDAAMAGSVVDILALHGVGAAAVTSAGAAFTFQRDHKPAVVICDQRLPDMTGLELCSAIRAIDPDVFLILLTGHASLDSAIAAVGQIDQYLVKPAPPPDLVAAVTAGTRRAEQRRADRREAEQAATRLAAIVEGTDDAVIAMTLDGVITGWNRGAEHLFGYRSEQVIGQPAALLVPRDHHDDLAEILQRIRSGHHVEHFETARVRSDSGVVHVSLSVSPIHDAEGEVVGASSIARDITDRIAAEQLRNELEGSAARHAQALQINDSIVQYLVVAQARLSSGDTAGGAAALDEGLSRARGLIDDLLPDPSSPGASGLEQPAGHARDEETSERSRCSVVIADDSAEIRMLVRMLLEDADAFDVLGEAGDGYEAIEAAGVHQPDLVLLDHSMPRLDGLGALPGIRQAAPSATVVMLSGFSADRLEDAALASGAAAYITKDDLAREMVPALRRVMGIEG